MAETISAHRPGGIAHLDWYHVTVTVGESRVTIYADGIAVGTGSYQENAADPTWRQAWTSYYGRGLGLVITYGQDEVRLLRKALGQPAISARAQKPRFWTPSTELNPPALQGVVPGFTSPLYAFPEPSVVTWARWDGYVPRLVRDAAEAWNEGLPASGRKVPVRVELLLYDDAAGTGEPRAVPLPEEFWLAGGGEADLGRLRCAAFRYRVWIDVSAVEGFNNETPVLDNIRVFYRGAPRIGSFSGE